MRIGVVGAGRIGGNLARLLTQGGHDVVISYARDAGELRARAAEFGCRAGSVAEAAGFGDVVVLSVPGHISTRSWPKRARWRGRSSSTPPTTSPPPRQQASGKVRRRR